MTSHAGYSPLLVTGLSFHVANLQTNIGTTKHTPA